MHRIYFRYLYRGHPWPKHLVWAIKELFGCDNLCIWGWPNRTQSTDYPIPITHFAFARTTLSGLLICARLGFDFYVHLRPR